jgi:DNA-binding response OmpR family regulator
MFLSSFADVEARIRGFEEGADDYLTKPFDLRELSARVRVLLRRKLTQEGLPPVQVLRCGDLTLDLQLCAVRVGTREARLTPAELDLLRYLIRNPNQVFSSQHLLQHVWGYQPDMADQGLVRWHVMNLRAKIETDPARPIYLRTLPRHGYMLAIQEQRRVA